MPTRDQRGSGARPYVDETGTGQRQARRERAASHPHNSCRSSTLDANLTFPPQNWHNESTLNPSGVKGASGLND